MPPQLDLSATLRQHVPSSVPGLSIAVVGPDGTRFATGVGRADIAQNTPASPQMVCPWFSMTKIVTATLILRLYEQGVLDLDEPVIARVPSVGHLRPEGHAARITPRHLLAHSAGLRDPIPVRWIHPVDEPGPEPGEFLDALLRKNKRLLFAPGARSSYSNLGALVLSSAITAATGRPFVDLVREEILRPLEMTRTDFRYSEDMLDAAATGYHPRRNPLRFLLPRWVVGRSSGAWTSLHPFLMDGPAYGGLVGPVDDAARFLQMHLRDGELDGSRIVSAEGARAMRKIATPGRRYDLGLGWFRPVKDRSADPPFIEHLGGGAGFWNVMRIYPDVGVGVVVMGNSTRYDVDAVARIGLASDFKGTR